MLRFFPLSHLSQGVYYLSEKINKTRKINPYTREVLYIARGLKNTCDPVTRLLKGGQSMCADPDLFEALKERIHCDYISDMRTNEYNGIARDLIFQMDLTPYSKNQIAEAVLYLCKRRLILEGI